MLPEDEDGQDVPATDDAALFEGNSVLRGQRVG